jgi:hypothetical protein
MLGAPIISEQNVYCMIGDSLAPKIMFFKYIRCLCPAVTGSCCCTGRCQTNQTSQALAHVNKKYMHPYEEHACEPGCAAQALPFQSLVVQHRPSITYIFLSITTFLIATATPAYLKDLAAFTHPARSRTHSHFLRLIALEILAGWLAGWS